MACSVTLVTNFPERAPDGRHTCVRFFTLPWPSDIANNLTGAIAKQMAIVGALFEHYSRFVIQVTGVIP